MAETWKHYEGYPRKCSECGGRVSLTDYAFFSSKVRKAKVIERVSLCAACLEQKAEGKMHCVYCGAITRSGVPLCRSHADLPVRV